MAKLSSSEFLNLTLALMNCQVVVAIFLGLVVAVGLIELPAAEVELLGRLPGWLLLLKLLHCYWIWLSIHEMWQPKVRAKLVQH
jgi:apolipoprotein N-acyltransferase